MRTLIKIGFGMLLLALVLIGLLYSALHTGGLSTSNNPAGRVVETEVRVIGKGINVVDLSGPIDLTLTRGPVPSLTLRGEQRLLANIVSNQEGKTLRIGIRGMLFHHRHPLQAELVLPELERLEITGSGDSQVNGFSGDKLALRMVGSGNVSFNGRFKDITAGLHGSGDLELNGGNSDKVALNLEGSGQLTAIGASKELKTRLTGTGAIDAQHLTTETCTVDFNGSGSTSVQASAKADVSLRGSGDITVYGNPTQRSVNRSGSGDVTWER